MSGYQLRVNGMTVQTIRLRPNEKAHQGFSVVIEDPEFGSFPLTHACVLEYMDLSQPKEEREADPAHGWRKVSIGELTDIAVKIKERAEGGG